MEEKSSWKGNFPQFSDDAVALTDESFTSAKTARSRGAIRHPRVLHLLSDYRPAFTGHGIYWEKLWPRLTALGGVHDVLVVQTPRPANYRAQQGSGAKLLYLSATAPERRTRKIIELNCWLLLHLHRYDVLHTHSHVDRYFLSHWLARVLRIPVIYSATLNDTPEVLKNSYRRSLRPYAGFMLKRMDHLIANGGQLAEGAARDLGSDRVSLIRNGVQCGPPKRSSMDLRRKLRIPEDALVLLCVGGICRRKATRLLVENHRRQLANGKICHLVLVGPDVEPGYASALRNLVAQHGLSDCIHFAGQSDDPASYYEMADIFVFASIREGFGNVVGEAMSMGLPAISRRLPGCTDFFITHGQTGFLFDNESEYRLYVDRLASDAALRSEMGHAARQWITRELSMDAAARQYQHVYDQCVKAERHPSSVRS
ncbi:MAG TPA: glycosyltransferase family 4 protein [Gammaproteobacteria bacterium]|nr:glycosyltransferase family 4 protein [Gammaproteobacteria bacterium]